MSSFYAIMQGIERTPPKDVQKNMGNMGCEKEPDAGPVAVRIDNSIHHVSVAAAPIMPLSKPCWKHIRGSKVSEPYVTEFGSFGMKELPRKNKNRKSKKSLLHGSCPLDADFWETHDDGPVEEFETWLQQGLLQQPKVTDAGVLTF